MIPTGGRVDADELFGALAFAAPLILVAMLHGWVGASYVGTTMLAMLIAKLSIARRARRQGREQRSESIPSINVCAVLPFHNEDPELAVAAVRSLLAQTRRIDRLHVIDDGSADDGATANALVRLLRGSDAAPQWQFTRLARNAGKRNALAIGFRDAPHADIFLCVDSDTVLDSDAVEHGLAPFADPRVSAVAGFVMALNWDRNFLTRLIDLRYVSAFLAERSAYSYFGSVLCCCGSLSFYRADIIRRNIDDFTSQLFLGEPATFGDDRRLTNYALRAGRVVLAERSRARTAVPERMGHYIRQQIRWNKSFVRESSWVLGTFPLRHGAFWLTLIEVVGWLFVGMLTLGAAVILPLMADFAGLATFCAVTALAAYARNAAYLENVRPTIERRDRVGVFLLAPVYAVIHVAVLLPLRIWSLVTLRRTGWGTRAAVEVRFAT